MASKELLSIILNTNVIEVYRRKNDNQLRMKTKTDKKDGWVSESDIPVPDLEKLSIACKRYAHKNKYRIDSQPLKSTLYKLIKTEFTKIDECINCNFEDPIIYDPRLDIELCETIIKEKLKCLQN